LRDCSIGRYNWFVESEKTLILTALEIEAKIIARVFGKRLEKNGDISLKVVGIGAKRLPALEGFRRIVVAGVAGALDPALAVGDLIYDAGGFEVLPVAGARLGKIYTADHLISTVEEKAALFKETGALAVDMETSHVRAAAPAGVLVLGLRAISDTARERLSPELMDWVDDVGKPMAGRLAAGLIRNPAMIPTLIGLGRRTSSAMTALGEALASYLGM
jgi:adenosylhomocysteine nucleosidase